MLTQTNRPRCDVTGDRLPQYAHPGDAGADLHSSEEARIPARGRKLVGTGIRLSLPPGCVGLIWPRSGLAVKQGLDCGAGVIDAGYRGEVKVLLFNHTDTDHCVQPGDKIAQLLVQKVERVQFVKVDSLEDSGRGDNGFGSTGK